MLSFLGVMGGVWVCGYLGVCAGESLGVLVVEGMPLLAGVACSASFSRPSFCRVRKVNKSNFVSVIIERRHFYYMIKKAQSKIYTTNTTAVYKML